METERKNSAPPVVIQPKNVFGIRSDVKGNVHFTVKQEVLYPVGALLAIHDYETDKQKFLRFNENSVPLVIAMSPNKKFIGVAEKFGKCWINIYDMSTVKKKKTLYLPNDVPHPEVEQLAFTYDSKGIAVLSKEPDAFLTIFFLDKAETVVMGRASNSNHKNLTSLHISCNLSDTGMVAVGGDYTLKLMSRQDKTFTTIGSITGEHKIVTSLTWISGDMLIVGTSVGKLLLVEGGEQKAFYCALTTDEIDLTIKEDNIESMQPFTPTDAPREDVKCLTYFSKGFCYSIHNVLYVYERLPNHNYKKKSIITIPMDLYDKKLYCIENVAINKSMDTVVVTPKHNQIYYSMLYVPEMLNAEKLEFKKLGEPLHIDGIISMSVCAWKPIIMTASLDQTIRIWNYETGKVELVKKYLVDVSVVALHPSGLLVCVGFLDNMQLKEVMLDTLKGIKTFNFPRCQDAMFSHQGHLLACAWENLISIISVFSFDVVVTLRGHSSNVTCVQWSNDDHYVFSCGTQGAVYEWKVATGERTNEAIQKRCEYRSLAVTKDMVSTYAVSKSGHMREIANSNIVREIPFPNSVPLTCVALARSDLVLFVASEQGHLYNIQIPFMEAGGGTCTNFRFFHNSINKMKITFNDKLLATGTADGTLVIWTIMNNEGRVEPFDVDLGKNVDIIISRTELMEKNSMIGSLERRIVEQLAEFQYQNKQNDAFASEKMRDIQSEYCAAIEALKTKNEEMEADHVAQFNVISENISQMKDEHAAKLMEIEAEFNGKILNEYDKTNTLKLRMEHMRDEYEMKLRKSAGCLQDTIEALETDFKKQLHERQDLIGELMKQLEFQKKEFSETKRQIELDNDRKIVELKVNYEKKLKSENDMLLKCRAEAGVTHKKFLNVTNNCDELSKEKDLLVAEHRKTRLTIRNLQKDVEELKYEIESRDQTIRQKEIRVNELLRKNEELEKNKQVLNYKIIEQKSQLEPREREIQEKKDEITNMEKMLEKLEHTKSKLELQMSELKDKLRSTKKESESERGQNINFRSLIQRMSSDIYHLSGYVQQPVQLKAEVMKLFQRYSDDKSLNKSIESDIEVENAFLRQRHYLEKQLERALQKVKWAEANNNTGKLLKDNIKLVTELNFMRKEMNELQKTNLNMESILGISGKYLPTAIAREKLAKACADFEEIELNHAQVVEKLQKQIQALSQENHDIRSELIEKSSTKI
ncbi:cilia- and flagella-associated protein 57 [Bradysia coprophila]|uniref:cilia- and flagella-associated protein 57 n=1 Tax=Bradysia coprophila TaxID=38358 RepID=UPI00187DC99F|nr:cilia- and flagella-associated protein 57 [Bradysia coprophila]